MVNNPDFQRIAEDLKGIGLKSGDSVLLHSSFKSMGAVEGGIETLVQALLSVIGDRGTLLAPTLTFRDVTAQNPVFDYVNTPSCVGAVSEYIRHMDGAIRSIHPTHSCAAIGFMAEEYTNTHYRDCTPVGENSPFYKLKENSGKILMLGCGLGCNTSMHGVEEAYRTFYVLPKEPAPYTIVLPEKTYQIDYYRHHISQNGYGQRYDRVANVLEKAYLQQGQIHGALSYLIDAPMLWKRGLETMAKDETYFVEKI